MTSAKFLRLVTSQRMNGWMEASLHEAIDELARSGRNDLASDLNRIMVRIDFDTLEVLRCSGAEGTADAILEAASIAELVGLLGQLCHVMGLHALHAARDQRDPFHELLDEGADDLPRRVGLAVR